MNESNSTESRIPPGQQLVAAGKWPVIGEREPAQSETPWSLSVMGEVSNPIVLSLEELRSLPQTSFTIDIHCVTRWSRLDVSFTGVLLKEILARVAPNNNANFASFVARSTRQHSTSLSINEAVRLGTLIALDVDGEPIETGHGGPLRNIVEGKYFYKSVKWLEKLEILENDRLGFWEAESGYHNIADPWKEQRYMVPTIDRRRSIKLIETRDFSGQELRSIDASDRDLENLNAKRASLRDANFTRANLTNADFTNANLSNAHFHNANLRGACFVDADVEGADFSGADLRDVDFSGCSVIGASFYSQRDGQSVEAIIDETTVLCESVITPLFPAQLDFVRKKLGKAKK